MTTITMQPKQSGKSHRASSCNRAISPTATTIIGVSKISTNKEKSFKTEPRTMKICAKKPKKMSYCGRKTANLAHMLDLSSLPLILSVSGSSSSKRNQYWSANEKKENIYSKNTKTDTARLKPAATTTTLIATGKINATLTMQTVSSLRPPALHSQEKSINICYV